MVLALFSAFICVLTRAILNICDRQVFKQENTDFWKSLAMNAFFPFLISFMIAYLFGEQNRHFIDFILQPGIILSAIGAQVVAYMISSCYKTMTVKSVVISSKFADLFIPLVIFLFTDEFKINNYLFSCLTTLIFIPLLFALLSKKTNFCFKATIGLVGVLIFQATVNSYFNMHRFADTRTKFLSMMSCILLWRAIFMAFPILIEKLKKLQNHAVEGRKKEVNYLFLFMRAFLAFISQAAFFYSIAGVPTTAAWPILNSTPFITSFSAHLFLKEKVGLLDVCILCAFLAISIFYLYTQGNLV